jgi:ATP/maltotriose-dependent transcriptional regulator MalT
MTYKGATYESIIDIKRLIMVEEAKLDTLKIKQKYLRLRNDPERNSVRIEINLQENFIKELNELLDNLLNRIEFLTSSMENVETEVFISKFINGDTNQEIMDRLTISQTTLYRYLANIEQKLSETSFGKEISLALEVKES